MTHSDRGKAVKNTNVDRKGMREGKAGGKK